MGKYANGEDRPEQDYSFEAIYRRCFGAGSLTSCVASYRQTAWNLDDAGVRAYSVSINDAIDSPRTSPSFRQELQRQEKHGGKKALDEFNRGARKCDEMNAGQPSELSPEERDFNLELLPHFRAFTRSLQTAENRKARLSAYDMWHMTFKGVCIKRKMVHLYDEETWIRNRQIHERKNRDAVPPPLTDAGRSGGQPTQPPR